MDKRSNGLKCYVTVYLNLHNHQLIKLNLRMTLIFLRYYFIIMNFFKNLGLNLSNIKIFLQKFLRSQIYTTLKNNTIEWEKQQKKKLDDLKKNLLLSFQNILTDFSNEKLSKEILIYVLIAFKQQILEIEKSVDQNLQNYLRKSWSDTYTATNYAYE